MNKMLQLGCAGFLCLMISSSAVQAADFEFTGKIKQVDRDKKVLLVEGWIVDKNQPKDQPKMMFYTINNATSFLDRSGRPIMAGLDSSLIQEGSKVSVRGTRQDRNNLAIRVRLGPK